MPNLYAQFKALFPDPPLLVGTVTEYANGTATVTLPDGATIRARGSANVDDKVFIRDGVIEGQAPALSIITIEV